MKRRGWLFLAWALLPLPAWWLHTRYGPLLTIHDQAGHLIQNAAEKTKSGDWPAVQASESQFLSLLPKDAEHQNDRMRAQLAIEDAKAHQQKQAEAINDLLELQKSIATDPTVSDLVRRDLRFQLARYEFYNAWRMRLDGAPQWLAHIERARQQFRYLAESADDQTLRTAAVYNTQACIRIERMDLSELLAIPPDPVGVSQQPSAPSDQDDNQEKKDSSPPVQDSSAHGELGRHSDRPHKGS